MEFLRHFDNMMARQVSMALATCVDGLPNVRMLNFLYDPRLKSVFFATTQSCLKVVEIERNPKVSFTTIPSSGDKRFKGYVRSIGAKAFKSTFRMSDLLDQFIAKSPRYAEIAKFSGPQLMVYEIKFPRALVTVDYSHVGEIHL